MTFYSLSIFVVLEVLFLLSGLSTIYGQDPYQWDILLFVESNPHVIHIRSNEKRGENPNDLVSKEHWTIHGIWPVIRGTLIPTFCNRKKGFNRREIQGIRRKLTFWWSPYGAVKDTESFWGYQWIKHGTCAPTLFPSEYYYFRQGLKWMDTYNLGTILESRGVRRGFQYPVSKIMNSIITALSRRPHIVCYKNPEYVYYLMEIWICFEKDRTITDCPYTLTNCREDVMYV